MPKYRIGSRRMNTMAGHRRYWFLQRRWFGFLWMNVVLPDGTLVRNSDRDDLIRQIDKYGGPEGYLAAAQKLYEKDTRPHYWEANNA